MSTRAHRNDINSTSDYYDQMYRLFFLYHESKKKIVVTCEVAICDYDIVTR